MVIGIPVLLVCLGSQPCQSMAAISEGAGSTAVALESARVPDVQVRASEITLPPRSLRRALEAVRMPTTGLRRDALAMQRARHARGTRSKGALILAGVVAGCFVGGQVGAAGLKRDDVLAGELIGAGVGAAIGGVLVAGLVR
jgi:hypothetical protein